LPRVSVIGPHRCPPVGILRLVVWPVVDHPLHLPLRPHHREGGARVSRHTQPARGVKVAEPPPEPHHRRIRAISGRSDGCPTYTPGGAGGSPSGWMRAAATISRSSSHAT